MIARSLERNGPGKGHGPARRRLHPAAGLAINVQHVTLLAQSLERFPVKSPQNRNAFIPSRQLSPPGVPGASPGKLRMKALPNSPIRDRTHKPPQSPGQCLPDRDLFIAVELVV